MSTEPKPERSDWILAGIIVAIVMVAMWGHAPEDMDNTVDFYANAVRQRRRNRYRWRSDQRSPPQIGERMSFATSPTTALSVAELGAGLKF